MSLRTRVVVLIGLALAVGVLLAALLAGYEAKRALQDELQAGMKGGEQTVASAFEDLRRSDHAERDLRQLVATFDGNRHVRAILTDGRNLALATSRSFAVARPAPSWFVRVLGPPPPLLRMRSPVLDRTLVLTPISDLDIGALWGEFLGTAAVIAASALVGLVLVYLAIGTALRPLRALSAGFLRIGGGDYQVEVPARGPSELTDLQRGFNAMAEQLVAMNQRNRILEAQVLTLQDEERADLARDLHDEIGPHLFAINVDAAVAAGLVGTNEAGKIAPHLRSIQASVVHMQRLVREILSRLRPSRATELGLNKAILDLAAFWKARAPQVEIACDLMEDEAVLDESLKDAVYRIVQESLNNAVRHAGAGHIAVRVARRGDEIEVSIIDDGPPASPRPRQNGHGGGFGIVGMRERVSDRGGVLAINTGGARGGWTVTAALPLTACAAAEAQA